MIGRSPEHCHVVLDPNGVSRKHAEIYRKGDDFFLADLNSRNMTKVNNTKVLPGVDHRLAPGDRINICDVEFLFYPRLPSDPQSKDGGDVMIVNEGESQDSPQLHTLDASRSSALARPPAASDDWNSAQAFSHNASVSASTPRNGT